MKPEPNDPRLTAYALGELESEAAEIEAQLAEDAALSEEVEEIRGMAALLTEELAQEPVVSIPPETEVGLTTSAGSSRARIWLPTSIAASILVGLIVIHFTRPAPNKDCRLVVPPSGGIAETDPEVTEEPRLDDQIISAPKITAEKSEAVDPLIVFDQEYGGGLLNQTDTGHTVGENVIAPDSDGSGIAVAGVDRDSLEKIDLSGASNVLVRKMPAIGIDFTAGIIDNNGGQLNDPEDALEEMRVVTLDVDESGVEVRGSTLIGEIKKAEAERLKHLTESGESATYYSSKLDHDLAAFSFLSADDITILDENTGDEISLGGTLKVSAGSGSVILGSTDPEGKGTVVNSGSILVDAVNVGIYSKAVIYAKTVNQPVTVRGRRPSMGRVKIISQERISKAEELQAEISTENVVLNGLTAGSGPISLGGNGAILTPGSATTGLDSKGPEGESRIKGIRPVKIREAEDLLAAIAQTEIIKKQVRDLKAIALGEEAARALELGDYPKAGGLLEEASRLNKKDEKVIALRSKMRILTGTRSVNPRALLSEKESEERERILRNALGSEDRRGPRKTTKYELSQLAKGEARQNPGRLSEEKETGAPEPVQLARATVVRRKEIRDELESSSYVKVVPPPAPSSTGEQYEPIHENPFKRTVEHPLSTFSVDVDTASYTNIRRFLNQGQLPPPAAVRIEEMVNFFDYDYAQPNDESPFAVHAEIAECPWRKQNRLAVFGLKGKVIAPKVRPNANLVFLLDVSGSMKDAKKLPLLKASMRMLVEKLRKTDRVALVTYASNANIVLGSTHCEFRETILAHIDNLRADGSTNGGSGIKLAYDQARQHFIKGGINRVILASDGDFNVGITDKNELVRLIGSEARSGVFLSVLGFGTGNLKDDKLEQIANKGNGHYTYIDSLTEGYRVLVEQMSSLMTIAKDMKIQVEFNPAKVAAYRLIGYENRKLSRQDFNNDATDAGEIGAGHTVTALYELVPAGQEVPGIVDKLKYQKEAKLTPAGQTNETLTLKLRYKLPNEIRSKRLEFGITDGNNTYANATRDFKFASSVAAFGMILRGSRYKGTSSLEGIQELADEAKGADKSGKRAEFLELVAKALRITGQ